MTQENLNLGFVDDIHAFFADNLGLKIVNVGDDGNCQPRALAHQVFGDEEDYQRVRNMMATYMGSNERQLRDFVPMDEGQTWDDVIDIVREDGEWLDGFTLFIFSQATGRTIECYNLSPTTKNMNLSKYIQAGAAPPIRVLFINNNHYQSLIQ